MREGTYFVTGATGAQGGSVARTLLLAGRSVRALTRNAGSDAANALRAAGAHVVEGDLADVATLARTMDGCSSVFGVTNFWEHFGTEIVHGKNLVDAARRTRVEHLVLSTLPSSHALSGGEISVPHFESKVEIEQYARRSGVPSTFVHVAFYYENFLSYFVPSKGPDGTLTFGFPQGATKLAAISVADVGPAVEAIFRGGESYFGEIVGLVGDELKGDEFAAALTHALERDVRYAHVPRETYAAFQFDGAADLAAMFDLNRRFILSRAPDLERTRTLHPSVVGFATWARGARASFASALAA